MRALWQNYPIIMIKAIWKIDYNIQANINILYSKFNKLHNR